MPQQGPTPDNGAGTGRAGGGPADGAAMTWAAAAAPQVQARRRLGDVLVASGLISAEQLQQALEEQRRPGASRRRLGQVVVDLHLATEKEVAECLADLLGLDMIDLSKVVPAPDVVRLLPRSVAERTNVLVLDRSPAGLVVAASDPTNVLALDDVRLYTRSAELQVLVATDSQIRDQIARAWSLGQDSAQVSAMIDEADDGDDFDASLGTVGDEAPIVKLVNQVLGDAVRLRASDIHLESQRDALRIRYRIDGLLRDVMNVPAPADQLGGQPDQDHVGAGHRRAPGAAGRAHPLPARRHGDRRPGQHPAQPARREGRDPAAHPRRQRPPAGLTGVRAAPAGHLPLRAGGAAGADPDHRADRLGEDQHAVLGDRRDLLPRPQHRHPRGPGRGAAATGSPRSG